MRTLRRPRKHMKGQDDHVDAWLMSYADMITILFMLFVIIVAYSGSKHGDTESLHRTEPQKFSFVEHFGTLLLGTPFDDTYGALLGVVASHSADQHIAIERHQNSLSIDLSAMQFFAEGTADIPKNQQTLLQDMVRSLAQRVERGDRIEVEGYTDDQLPLHTVYANNWELSAMRAARIATMLLEAGFDGTHLRTISYASNKPLVPNNDERGNPISENQRKNQRVVIRVIKKRGEP